MVPFSSWDVSGIPSRRLSSSLFEFSLFFFLLLLGWLVVLFFSPFVRTPPFVKEESASREESRNAHGGGRRSVFPAHPTRTFRFHAAGLPPSFLEEAAYSFSAAGMGGGLSDRPFSLLSS